MTAVLDMVTLQKIGNSMNREILEITGLSTDDKPIDFINLTYITNGSTFEEIDTGTIYKYNEDAKEWIEQPSAGVSGGNISLDYTALTNKPQIGGKELTGNKTLDELGIQPKGTYITKETDPTVPAWAKESQKPTYTADEVGALPKTTTSLPNPKKIKFTGAVTDEYDGSTEKTINIPTGNSYTLPQATEVVLGGIKAKTKTNETVEVTIDTTTGKLFVPAYPTGSGVELDKTLAVEGKAADAKAVGNNITTLQNEIEMSGILKYKKVDITDTFKYVNGYYGIKDGVLNTTSNKSTTKIPCKKGDKFVIEKADQQTLTCVLAIWDKNSKFIKGGNGYGSGKITIASFPFEYTCEENDAFIAFGYAPLKVYKYIQSSFEEDLLQSVDKTMRTVTLEIYNTKKSESILDTLDIENKYLTQTGSFESYNDARGTSIECKSGEIYYITGNGGNLSRVLGAVHNNGEFEVVLGVGTFEDYLYIVPEDVKELRYSTLNTDIFDIAKGEINESDSKIQKIETDLADLKANKGFAFKGKIGFAFGDSMTHGYSGGFIKYIESKTGAKITNYGHPGDGAKNMLGIITNGKYGSVNHNYNEPTLCDDYSNCSFVTIMIGTNGGINANWRDDFSKLPSLTYNQNMSHLPFEKDKVTISTADEYYKLFADNHTSYLAFAIEYLKYKNPNMFIFLVTPPPRKGDDMLEFREFLLTLGKRYGVPVIDAISNGGIDLSTFSDYSVDGTHFNEKGNIKWGNYIGHKINEYGQIYL